MNTTNESLSLRGAWKHALRTLSDSLCRSWNVSSVRRLCSAPLRSTTAMLAIWARGNTQLQVSMKAAIAPRGMYTGSMVSL